MTEEKRGGASVYISPEIVEVLKQYHKKNYETGIVAGLDPLMTPEPSIGSLVHSCLLAALGMYKDHGGEQWQAK